MSSFVVGLYGRDEALHAYLTRMLSDISVRGKSIEIRQIQDLPQVRQVHLLVLEASRNPEVRHIQR